MPTCSSCKKSNEAWTLTEDGLCPICASIAMKAQLSKARPVLPQEKPPVETDPELAGLYGFEKREVLRRRERTAKKMDALKARGMNGFYEYKVIDFRDERSGSVNIERMTNTLNDLGEDGWRVITAFSNDLGINSMSTSVGSMRVGTNASIAQNIFVLERFVPLKD